MNIDYSQLYRGTTNIQSQGSGAYRKDALVKYEFNTTDEHGSMVPESQEAMEARNAAFQKDIVQIDNSLSDLPAYSGMYGEDKAIASALEGHFPLKKKHFFQRY